jgi:hypothetical protein
MRTAVCGGTSLNYLTSFAHDVNGHLIAANNA